MNINFTDAQLVIIRRKREQFNLNNTSAQLASNEAFVAMVLADLLALYEGEVTRQNAERQTAEFHKLTNQRRRTALESVGVVDPA